MIDNYDVIRRTDESVWVGETILSYDKGQTFSLMVNNSR